jgi:hypothetical protein
MTRKDYILIAAAIKYVRDNSGNACERTAALVAVELAMQLATDNPRFDRERFLKACGVKS